MPLDLLVRALASAPSPLPAAAAQLRHNSVCMVGVGYEQPLADDRSWMCFPEPEVPFYRAIKFAKYASANVSASNVARNCSYVTEMAYSREKPEPRAGLEARVARGLRTAGVIEGAPPIASIHDEDLLYAYPVPTRGRDAALGSSSRG